MGKAIDLKPSMIFIPDISGFTNFINEVEVDHSTHIITELIEIIIESNILKLKVSEIEGDAVLFYRVGDEPSFDELVNQTEHMFLEFHRHLKFYERDRICQCGACSTAHTLTLKFVYHFGKTTLRKIKKHKKLFGPDVTLAHRLLKNDVQASEYMLMSSVPVQIDKSNVHLWISLQQGRNEYDGIGEIDYTHFSLSPLTSRIPVLPERKAIRKYHNPISVSTTAAASLEIVHSILTDNSLKPKWMLSLLSVSEEREGMKTIGSKHLCKMPISNMILEVMGQNLKGGVIEYAEKTESIGWLSPLIFFYTLKRISQDQTKISVDLNYKQNILSKLYLDFPLRIMMGIMMKVSVLRLRKLATG